MQVFNTYFKIFKKQLVPILIYVVLFLCLAVIMISRVKDGSEKFEATKANVMVVNEDDQTSLMDGFLKYMENYITLVETEEDEDARRDALFHRKAEYILTIPKGFTESFLAGEDVSLIKQSIPDSAEALPVDNAIDNYFNMAKVYIKHIPEIEYDQLNLYVEQSLREETQVNLSVEVEEGENFSNVYNMSYFNYLGYIIIYVFIIGVSIVMFSFHGIDIRRRHFASPLTYRKMNAQLLLANFTFVIGYVLLFVIAGYVLNRHREINANTLLTWLNVFLFSLTALGISYLVGISVKNKKAISALATALSLGLAFISGLFVPQEFLGEAVLKVASFTPTYWYAKTNNALVTVTSFRWSEVSEIFGYMGIQIGFAAAIISIALVVSKRKRQQQF